jgi:hypothetical protein
MADRPLKIGYRQRLCASLKYEQTLMANTKTLMANTAGG